MPNPNGLATNSNSQSEAHIIKFKLFKGRHIDHIKSLLKQPNNAAYRVMKSEPPLANSCLESHRTVREV